LPILSKRKGATRVSVVLPALDEEPTVGEIVTGVRMLAERTGLVDEIVVVDSGSVDRTAEVAAEAGADGAPPRRHPARLGSYRGKGEVLWKALMVTTGDILVYVDADLTDFGEHYVTGLLGPLLADETVTHGARRSTTGRCWTSRRPVVAGSPS
jgi:glucosyl-3-phosphoglycerate synthase